MRSHTSQAISRKPNTSHSATIERPSTVTGCCQLPIQLTRTPESHTKPDNALLHTDKWNNCTRVDKPSSAISTTQSITSRPSASRRDYRPLSSVAVEIFSVQRLCDQNTGSYSDYAKTKTNQNKAVQAAFDRAINHKTVTSDRLRTGLITNDFTPRVYLPVSVLRLEPDL